MGFILAFLILIFFVVTIKSNKSTPKTSSKSYKYSSEGFETYRSSAEVLGEIGEKEIARILNSLPIEYHVFNDIYLYRNGMTTQIDHIVVSPYGIFVIETKNYKGWIYGSDTSEYWTENMFGKKYKFYNPIKQNYSHVNVLQQILKIPSNKFIPIVVFSKEAELKFKTNENVIYSFWLINFIEKFKKPLLNISDVEKIANQISYYNIDNKRIKEVHKKNIQQRVYQKKVLISEGICPKCSGRLIERTGRYGKFLGCSNYPKCDFKIKWN